VKATRQLIFVSAFVLLAVISFKAAVVAAEEAAISPITRHCAGCHPPLPDQENSYTRISEQRKSPEGWAMTIARMQQLGRLQITKEESRGLVKELSDSHGLTPAEAADYRYALEQQPNYIETIEDEALVIHCARCHTGARVALQRRTEEEWRLLGHYHIGQYPNAELSGSGREYDIYKLFTDELPKQLVKDYPLDMDAWNSWKSTTKSELSGSWMLVGNQPGKGDFSAVMTATATTGDGFALAVKGEYADGTLLVGKGSAVVFSGFEWRGSLTFNDQAWKQVFAANIEGDQMQGRMFMTRHVETGISMQLRKMGSLSAVMQISPAYIKAGSKATLSISGTGLEGDINLGQGIKVKRILSKDKNRIVAQVKASKRAREGSRTVQVGDAVLDNNFTVYRKIAAIKVVPESAIARVGDNGGTIPKVTAAFQALALAAGSDGEANTADDISIGYLPAQWTVKPFDEQAVEDEDLKFAGVMDKNTGVFTPGAAGPNPERKFITNNAGNLGVVAVVSDGKETLQAEGHLVVTVQRWLNPLIQ
jgi:quinohemoprotein amine dehydrogenase